MTLFIRYYWALFSFKQLSLICPLTNHACGRASRAYHDTFLLPSFATQTLILGHKLKSFLFVGILQSGQKHKLIISTLFSTCIITAVFSGDS